MAAGVDEVDKQRLRGGRVDRAHMGWSGHWCGGAHSAGDLVGKEDNRRGGKYGEHMWRGCGLVICEHGDAEASWYRRWSECGGSEWRTWLALTWVGGPRVEWGP